MMTSRPTSLSDPFPGINLDEILDAFSAGYAQGQWAAFAFHPHVEVKERTAQTFLKRPFSQELIRLFVLRKFKLKSIRKFSYTLSQRDQSWTEFFKVSLSHLWS